MRFALYSSATEQNKIAHPRPVNLSLSHHRRDWQCRYQTMSNKFSTNLSGPS